MKRISDKTKAGIFCFVWESFLYLGLIIELVTGSMWGYVLWLLDTAVSVTILVYEAKVSKLEKALKKSRQRLAKQSMEFAEYIRTPGQTDRTRVFNISTRIRRKRKSA